MAKFALVSEADVVNVVVADSVEQVGVMADLFTVVDVTLNDPQPSVGWTYANNVFYPPKLDDAVRAKWNGATFDTDDVIDAEVVEEDDDKDK